MKRSNLEPEEGEVGAVAAAVPASSPTAKRRRHRPSATDFMPHPAPPAASFNNSPSSKNFTISMEPKNPYGPALEKYESSVSIVVLHIRISVYLLGVHAYTAVVLTLRFSPCFSPFASSQVLGTTVPFVFAV